MPEWSMAVVLEGFDVTTAASGEESLRATQRHRPQVVLMDLAMPGVMDGWEATRRIKVDPAVRTTRIAVTAHASPEHKQRAIHAGCNAVFTKPYDLSALADHVAQAVRELPDPSA